MTTTTFVDEVTVIEASWLNDVNADVYGVRPVATGGTGATDAADARTNLGLGNVDNTSDANKPVSTAQQAALNLKANILSPSFTTPSLGVATATSLQGIIGNVTPAAGTFTTLTSTGNAALGDAEATDTHAIKGATTLLANSASAALTVTQTGAGNAFVVEDSASTDSTPFVIDANGNVVIGTTAATTKLHVYGAGTAAAFYTNGDAAGSTAYVQSSGGLAGDGGQLLFGASQGVFAGIKGLLTNGTGPAGDLVFQTRATSGNVVEGMRLSSLGGLGVGATPIAGRALTISKNVTGAVTAFGILNNGTIQSDVTTSYFGNCSAPSTAAASFTLTSLVHYYALQGTLGASSAVTNQYGFFSDSALTGATNNYGFHSAIAAGTNRWNFYSAGTANNAYAGNSSFGKVTAPTSAVDTTSFAVGFATNSGATCTVGSTDHTIVQTTTASTYTLPAASSFPGRILKLLTQFAGAVVSASSNVVPIAGGAAGTAILAATAGKYAVLQSTGTNWQITEAN